MNRETQGYIQLHLKYIFEIESGISEDNFSSYSSIYEHMHDFFMTLGLSSEKAMHIINDFRNNSSK